MTIDPFEPIKVLIIGVCALVLGAVLGGVPAYFTGRTHQAEKTGKQIGALQTSVASCTAAAQESNKLIERERAAGDERERSMRDALNENAKARPQYRAAASRALAYQPTGDTECARTVDTVRALVMGSKR